jgi:hypothetical protein
MPDLTADDRARLKEIAYWAEKRGMVLGHISFLRKLAEQPSSGDAEGRIRRLPRSMNHFFRILINGRPPQKVDFRLRSAEGSWGYPEDLLVPAAKAGGVRKTPGMADGWDDEITQDGGG